MTDNMLNVLWVENDPNVLLSYPLEAENYGLNLQAYECWEDALKALEADYDKWDAIILDAKCKVKKDCADNAMRFLPEATNSLTRLATEHKRQINWYILSGGSEEEINDLILDEREKWDKDFKKKYYSKSSDEERRLLYLRIRYHAKRSHSTQIKTTLYRPVFDAISESNLDEEVEFLMTELLSPMHFDDVPDKDYNNRFKNVRQVIEYIFRSMFENGIMPEDALQSNGRINLAWSSKFLNNKDNDEVPYKASKKIFNETIGKNVWNMISTTGSFLHANNPANSENNTQIHEYLRMTGNSSYLIRSFALQLCDLILWYNNYLKQNPNKEKNMSNWKSIESSTSV